MATSMTFNQFQKELQRRVSDPQLAYVLTFLFESLMTQQKQIDDMASAMMHVASNMEQIVKLNDAFHERMNSVERASKADGINVESVADDPEVDN